ncbi:MAG: Hpt domain-containing protein, partial [Rubrivivax sp.]
LGQWVEAIAAGRFGAHDAAGLSARADALRLGRSLSESTLPAEQPSAGQAQATAALLERVPHLPSAEDLRFDLDLPPAPAAAAADHGLEPFVLDLRVAADDGVESIQLDPGLDWQGEHKVEFAGFADTRIDPSLPVDDASPGPDSAASVADALHLDLHDEPAPLGEPPLEDEQFKIIGDLRIGIALFNIYLNEADELSRRLCTELSEWAMESELPLGESTAALAHSLAGSSATVGYVELSGLARSLEHALARSIALGRATPGEPELFNDAADEIRHLLHQFAAGFLKRVSAPLMKRLEQHELDLAAANAAPEAPEAREDAVTGLAAELLEPLAIAEVSLADEIDAAPPPPALPDLADAGDVPIDLAPLPSLDGSLGQAALTPFSALPQSTMPVVHARRDALDDEDDIDAVDQVDEELFPIFCEEGEELLPQLQSRMRDWVRRPSELAAAAACMRTLHTFKGGARLAGAMRLGEMAHRLETAIEHLLAQGQAGTADVELLLARVDAICASFELLGRPAEDAAGATPVSLPPLPASPLAPRTEVPVAESKPVPLPQAEPALDEAPTTVAAKPALPAAAMGAAVADIDWGRFKAGANVPLPAADKPMASAASVRVRAPLLDRLVNQAGEVSITRARIESDVGQIKGSLGDLTENLERLRRQLRDLEL